MSVLFTLYVLFGFRDYCYYIVITNLLVGLFTADSSQSDNLD